MFSDPQSNEEVVTVGLDDMVSTESAFVAAATAAVLSPKTRATIRKGAVYGVAGALKAGDVVAGAARGVVRGVRGDGTAVADAAPTSAPRATSRRASSSGASRGTRRTGNSSGSRSSARRATARATKSARPAAGA
jgi:hypothetical protein